MLLDKNGNPVVLPHGINSHTHPEILKPLREVLAPLPPIGKMFSMAAVAKFRSVM